MTLGPLIRRLSFPPDRSFAEEVAAASVQLIDAAGDHPRSVSEFYADRMELVEG